jgi:hypothetical protein
MKNVKNVFFSSFFDCFSYEKITVLQLKIIVGALLDADKKGYLPFCLSSIVFLLSVWDVDCRGFASKSWGVGRGGGANFSETVKPAILNVN